MVLCVPNIIVNKLITYHSVLLLSLHLVHTAMVSSSLGSWFPGSSNSPSWYLAFKLDLTVLATLRKLDMCWLLERFWLRLSWKCSSMSMFSWTIAYLLTLGKEKDLS